MTTPIDQFKGKQLDIINWWRRYPDKQTIIADGAVRSGKTFAMSISYVLWHCRQNHWIIASKCYQATQTNIATSGILSCGSAFRKYAGNQP